METIPYSKVFLSTGSKPGNFLCESTSANMSGKMFGPKATIFLYLAIPFPLLGHKPLALATFFLSFGQMILVVYWIREFVGELCYIHKREAYSKLTSYTGSTGWPISSAHIIYHLLSCMAPRGQLTWKSHCIFEPHTQTHRIQKL